MTAPPEERIAGLHHVTSIAGDPRRNIEFYTELLGLRFIKRTVNFDDPSTYHFYYGDEMGHPGTTLTFFATAEDRTGTPGRGQTAATAFAVPEGSLEYWRNRLADRDVDVGALEDRFGDALLPFRDHDGHPMELVESSSDVGPWSGGPVPVEHGLRGFHGITLDSRQPDATADVLELLGFERTNDADGRVRYAGPADRARFVDILDRPDGNRGRPGPGTVHHVAFRTADEQTELAWRDHLLDQGLRVTEQKDRHYFKSIYFREPGGILFEIATESPGFSRDQRPENFGGDSLQLPPWLEDDRAAIESHLPEI